jgi:hypothetical protein
MFDKPIRTIDRHHLNWVKQLSCVACGRVPCDPDHIKTRGAGGGDDSHNVWPLCRLCHVERHAKGLRHMATKYQGCARFLNQNGWTWDPLANTYKHRGDDDSQRSHGTASLLPEVQ